MQNLIRPLQIGNKTFPVNIIQGPLAGYSGSAFRSLLWQYSNPAFTCTEMISSNALAHQPDHTQKRYMAKDLKEGPTCFQIFGNDPEKIGLATRIVTDYGADLIDLNCGCPVKKVRRQGAGSYLLTEPTLLYKLIVAMKKNTSLPVTIKIRVEGSGREKFHNDIVKVVNDSGVDCLVVHGRHWTESYKNPCHLDQIQFFVDALKIPVIGNGDVSDINSLQKMFATKCAGVMVARASIGRPWLIQKLITEANQQNFLPPTFAETKRIFMQHIQLLEKLLGNERQAVLEARKIAGAYMHGLRHKKEFCLSINTCQSINELKCLLA